MRENIVTFLRVGAMSKMNEWVYYVLFFVRSAQWNKFTQLCTGSDIYSKHPVWKQNRTR